MKNNAISKIITAAIGTALTLTLVGCEQQSGLANEPAEAENKDAVGKICLSVNTEIEVEYDEEGIVLEVEDANDDGKNVAGSYKDFDGKDCALVVKELVKEIYNDGYFETQLDGHDKNIVIKLETGSAYPNEVFLESG